jgi:hypothetical protein
MVSSISEEVTGHISVFRAVCDYRYAETLEVAPYEVHEETV